MRKAILVGLIAGLAFGTQTVSAQTTQTLQVRISLDTDDMERRVVSGVPELDIDSSDIEIGSDGASRPNTVGLRFTNIGLPAAATVVSAHIQFTGDGGDVAGDVGIPSVVIRGEATSNSVTFSTSNVQDIVTRTTTTASVNWDNIPTWGAEAATANERTPNLKAIVDEIRTVPGWQPGRPMAFIISQSPGNERTAHAFEGVPGAAALLVIEYLAPARAYGWELYE